MVRLLVVTAFMRSFLILEHPMKKYNRRRLLVDPAFQFRLLARMAAHLLAFVFVAFHIGFIVQLRNALAANNSEGLPGLYVGYLSQQGGLLVGLVVCLPILLYDLLRFSNRIAGPLFRCRKT